MTIGVAAAKISTREAATKICTRRQRHVGLALIPYEIRKHYRDDL